MRRGSPASRLARTWTGSSSRSEDPDVGNPAGPRLAAAAFLGYTIYVASPPSPLEERARAEIASGEAAASPARPGRRARKRGRARTSGAGARLPAGRRRTRLRDKRFDEAFRLAVESQSYSRRALGRLGAGRAGRRVASSSSKGTCRCRRAGRSTFETRAAAPAALRRRLHQDGTNGLGRDHVLRRHALHDPPGLALRSAAVPASSEASGSQIKMVSGAVNVYTSASTSTVATDAATAAIDRESRVSVDVRRARRPRSRPIRGRTTVSTGKETVVLEDREKVVGRGADAPDLRQGRPSGVAAAARARRTTGCTT